MNLSVALLTLKLSFIRIIIFRYPSTAELAYGHSRRGCFENPNDTRPPKGDIECPDIFPVEYEERVGLPNPLAMKNPSALVTYIYLIILAQAACVRHACLRA